MTIRFIEGVGFVFFSLRDIVQDVLYDLLFNKTETMTVDDANAEIVKAAQQSVQLTAFGVGMLALLAGVGIGWVSCLAFIGGN